MNVRAQSATEVTKKDRAGRAFAKAIVKGARVGNADKFLIAQAAWRSYWDLHNSGLLTGFSKQVRRVLKRKLGTWDSVGIETFNAAEASLTIQ